MRNLTNLHRLKNSDFILESKMVELNKKERKKEKKRKFETSATTRCSEKAFFDLELNE